MCIIFLLIKIKIKFISRMIKLDKYFFIDKNELMHIYIYIDEYDNYFRVSFLVNNKK
jgi:hypothetical protein